MSMPLVQLSMYEALTEAGVKPDAARKVERQLESAIQAGQDAVRAEMREQLMTKADGESIKAEVLKALNEQTWRLVGFVVVANGIMLAILRLLP